MGKKSRKGNARSKTQRAAAGQGTGKRKGSMSDNASRTSQDLSAENSGTVSGGVLPKSVVVSPESIVSKESVGMTDTAATLLQVPTGKEFEEKRKTATIVG